MVTYYDPNDPLSILLAPPPNETVEECRIREANESKARKVSLRIDEELKADKAAMKKRKSSMNVLVLGQSESGMSFALFSYRIFDAHGAHLGKTTVIKSSYFEYLAKSQAVLTYA